MKKKTKLIMYLILSSCRVAILMRSHIYIYTYGDSFRYHALAIVTIIDADSGFAMPFFGGVCVCHRLLHENGMKRNNAL